MNKSLEYLALRRELAHDINEIFKKHHIVSNVEPGEFHITDKIVTDVTYELGDKKRISELLIDYLWPSINESDVLYHYTSRESAENIIKNETLRLYSINKRIHEDEILSFCQTHNLTGYLEKDENDIEEYKKLLAPTTFYSSFVNANLTVEKEEYFWRNFASGDGVRIKFKIEARKSDFRKIYYEGKVGGQIPILRDLNNLIAIKYNRIFVMHGISRLCCFYLPGSKYSKEMEYRLLLKAYDDSIINKGNDGYYEYIQLPINNDFNYGYKLSLLDVCSNERPNIPDNITFYQRK
jgi:hypothetical protein